MMDQIKLLNKNHEKQTNNNNKMPSELQRKLTMLLPNLSQDSNYEV